ncbi:MAG: ABC transporter permease subunit [Sedimentisphaerales bacterium]|nr:ABC transporter permease subunit [Sedimentisphaerales bacterium]
MDCIFKLWAVKYSLVMFASLIWIIKIAFKDRRIRDALSKKEIIVLRILSLVILTSIYLFLSHRQHIINPDDSTMPAISQLAEGIRSISRADEFTNERWIVVDAKATFSRFFLGLAFTVVLSISWGIIIGCFKVWKESSVLPLVFFSFIPPTAAMPVFFVIMGTDMAMYIALIVFGTFPVLARAICLAVDEIDDEFIFKSQTLGASRCEVIYNVIFKQIFPKILDSVRLQIGIAVILLIAAEMMCGDAGFGYRIRIHYKLANMSVLYPYCAILAGFGFLLDSAFRKFNEYFCPWYFNLPARKRICYAGRINNGK